MTEPLTTGIKHRESFIVAARHTVPEVEKQWPGFGDLPPVLATALMIGFMEQTCVQALRPFLAAGENTVGTAVDVTHTAATLPGQTVTAIVELTAIDGRNLIFSVECRDGNGLIGSGTHRRTIINNERFLNKLMTQA